MEIEKCEYSNSVCKIEPILARYTNSEKVKDYVNRYCCSNKELCEQYQKINEFFLGGIEGFFKKEIKETESELLNAGVRYLALQVLKVLSKNK